MYIQEKKSNKLAHFLPTYKGSSPASCKDEQLKEKITFLYNEISEKIDPQKDWDNQDYKDFIRRLQILETSTFNNYFEEIIKFIRLPKTELESTLRTLDNELNTHVFEDERYSIPVKDENTGIINQVYKYQKHTFQVGDLIQFIRAFNSKLDQFSTFTLRQYNQYIKNDKTPLQQEKELELLSSLIENEDSEMIKLIRKRYQEIKDRLSNKEIILPAMDRMEETLVSKNIENLKKEYRKIKSSNNKPDSANDYFEQGKFKNSIKSIKR